MKLPALSKSRKKTVFARDLINFVARPASENLRFFPDEL